MRRMATAGLAVALAGCLGDAPPAGGDSIGGSATLIEDLRIDGRAEDLVPIGAVAVDRLGKIAITQPQDGLIRLYSEQGAPIGRFGRTGDGPGEFQNPFWMAWAGDTLKVYDGRQDRLTTISPELQLVGTSPVSPRATGGDRRVGAVYPRGMRRDGLLLGGLSAGDDFLLGMLGQDGVVHRVLARLPDGENVGAPLGDGGWIRLPFANEAQYGISPRGDRVAIAMAAVDGSDAETFLLTVVDVEGDTLVHRRYAFKGEPVSREAADSIIAARVARLPSTEAVAVVRSATIVPPVYPPITSVVVGGDGSIWVEMRAGPDGRPYQVIAPEGRPMGMVLVPARGRIAAATLDRIHVLEPDALDVQSVVRYAVRW